MTQSARPSINLLGACALLAVCAGATAPAFAQPVVGEVVVIGRYGAAEDARRLSAPVSYRDLDLTTVAGRDSLKDRVRAMAHDLCRQLGEADQTAPSPAASCEQGAIDSARDQEQIAFETATAPVYAVAAPSVGYAAPAGPNPMGEAAAAPSYGAPASATVTTETVTNGPVPDTPQNRAAYGGPQSHGGRRTAPAGN
jgi:UrcA family protein